MKKIDRTNIRAVMNFLKNNNVLCLNGTFIKQDQTRENKFQIENTYNGQNGKFERNRNWVKNFIKNDYLHLDLYLIGA